MVSIAAFQAVDPGSIPGRRIFGSEPEKIQKKERDVVLKGQLFSLNGQWTQVTGKGTGSMV